MSRQRSDTDPFEVKAEDLARAWEKLPKIARAFIWLAWWAMLLLLVLMSGCTASVLSWGLV